jgi:hypothetical protein
MEAEATKLQEAAYGAQLAAGLRVSDLATAVLISADGTIHHRSCAAYIHALQCSDWYAVAFTGYTGPVTVAGDCGPDRQLREPTRGRESSKGHHHAWRVNFVLIVRKTVGNQAAQRLKSEFGQWRLQTSR